MTAFTDFSRGCSTEAFSRVAGEYPVGIPAMYKVEVEFENQSDPCRRVLTASCRREVLQCG